MFAKLIIRQYRLYCMLMMITVSLCSCSTALNPWHSAKQDKLVDFKKRRPPKENMFIAHGGLKKNKKDFLLPQQEATDAVPGSEPATQSLQASQKNLVSKDGKSSTSEKLLNIFKKQEVTENRSALSSTVEYNMLACMSKTLESELCEAHISDSALQAARNHDYPELSDTLIKLRKVKNQLVH